jgi:hypothetical protein
MKILELFSGTGSIGKVFPNDEVVSVDNDIKFNPTHNISIFDFDYKQYEYFDYIHASPPCQYFSICQTSWYNREKRINGIMTKYSRELHEKLVEEISDKLVLKTLEIIHYFNPKCYTIENPYNGYDLSLSKRSYMQPYNYCIVNYCMYNYPVKKPTIFFNNFDLQLNKCDKLHKHNSFGILGGGGGNPYSRYAIPSLLCESIKDQIKQIIIK